MEKILGYIKFYWFSLNIFLFKKLTNLSSRINYSYLLATLYNKRGTVLHEPLCKYQEAIKDFTKSLEVGEYGSNEGDYYFNRGLVYVDLNQHEEAIDDFSASIFEDKEDKIGYYHRAISYLATGMYKEAIEDLDKIIGKDPKKALIHYLREIGLKLEEKQKEEERKTIDTFIEKVQVFQEKMFGPILRQPLIPVKKKCQLRVNLLQEELDELKVGIKDKNIIAIADALCDLQYVLSGAIIEFGLGDKIPQLFNEVHRSNMSKFCDNQMLALKTQEKYQKEGVESYFKEVDGKFLVYRKKDDKLLKSINYSPADLSSVIQTEIIFPKS